MTLLPRLSILLSLATCTHALRFLALHGGTDNPTTFQGQMGAIVAALGSGHTWVWAQGAYTHTTPGEYLWIRDAPGGKNAGTTDPNWAQSSFTYLDNMVATQGPFDAIVGYSQGAAMTILYLSQASASFRFAVTFCGYLPTVHTGLIGRINAASPMSIPILFYYGTNDNISTNSMTISAASHFSAATMVSDGGQHDPPSSGPALTATVNFINAQATTALSRGRRRCRRCRGSASSSDVRNTMPPIRCSPLQTRSDPPLLARRGRWRSSREKRAPAFYFSRTAPR